MSDIQRVEQKIDMHISEQQQSNRRVEDALNKLSEAITTFVGFQARAEERLLNDKEWRQSVEQHQDRQDERIAMVEKVSNKNALLVNGAVGVLSLVLGSAITWLIAKIGG
jgi:adenosyl cobinamide kinase/adenosyl cobinamide phosphate guanylyltransferase